MRTEAIGRLDGARLRVAASVAALALLCALSGAAHAQVTIELRGGLANITARSAEASVQGLEVVLSSSPGSTSPGSSSPGLSPKKLLAWDEVRGVVVNTGEHPAQAYLALAEDLWRARVRIARGDTQLAAPLLARHWNALREVDGPTGQLVAEGWLRCMLAAGDSGGVIDGWIATIRHQAAGAETRFPELPPLLDPATGLLPALSPFAPRAVQAEVVARCEVALERIAGAAPEGGAKGDVEGSGRTGSSDTLWRFARLTRAADLRLNPAPPSTGSAAADTTLSPASRALAGLEAIVMSVDARTLERTTAEFDRAFAEPKAFLGAWRLAAIGAGRARIARSMPEAERAPALIAAALDLLAVPASRLDPAGMVDAYAIEAAAALMREAGDTQTAEQLERMLGEVLAALGNRAADTAPSDMDRGARGWLPRDVHDRAYANIEHFAYFAPDP